MDKALKTSFVVIAISGLIAGLFIWGKYSKQQQNQPSPPPLQKVLPPAPPGPMLPPPAPPAPPSPPAPPAPPKLSPYEQGFQDGLISAPRNMRLWSESDYRRGYRQGLREARKIRTAGENNG